MVETQPSVGLNHSLEITVPRSNLLKSDWAD